MIKKILFISPDASRTGAPKVLLLTMQWLKRNQSEIEITLLILKKGDLFSDFQDTVDILIFPDAKRIQNFFYHRVLKRKKKKVSPFILKSLTKKSFDLIYCNSVNTFEIGVDLKNKNPNSQLVGHFHEKSTVIDILCPNFINLAGSFEKFLAASYSVKEDLINFYNISDRNISVVYESAVVENIKRTKYKKSHFHIGGSGTVHWRKGVDVFIQVARIFREKHPESEVKFTWLGAISREERLIQEADLRKLGLLDEVSFPGLVKDPDEIYSTFDVFLLTSREDPFPLAAIEVGKLGVPIICFEKASGTAEIIRKGGGFIVPYLNTEAMADKLGEYHLKPELHTQHSEECQRYFSNFTPEQKSNEIFNKLMEVLK